MPTKSEKLVQEIAYALNDQEALPLYESFAGKYSEAFLRKILMRVLSVPDHKIKRTRGALFTYLVGQHERQSKHGARD